MKTILVLGSTYNSLENFRNMCHNKLDNKEFYKNFIPMFFIEIYKRLDKIIIEREAFIKLINKNK